jgi:hypothetical protein
MEAAHDAVAQDTEQASESERQLHVELLSKIPLAQKQKAAPSNHISSVVPSLQERHYSHAGSSRQSARASSNEPYQLLLTNNQHHFNLI